MENLDELNNAIEESRDHSLGLNEEKLMENLLILIVKLEHRCWRLGFDVGYLKGKLGNDTPNNPSSIFLDKKE